MAAKAQKLRTPKQSRAVIFWHRVTTDMLTHMPVDLSLRQMAILSHIYAAPPPHSVKSLSESLAISKAAVCRAVDTLERERLVRRAPDKRDKRNVFVQRTVKGSGYLSDLADLVQQSLKLVK